MKRAWTSEEDTYLKNNWQQIPTKEIAEKLNRPARGCQKRSCRLGLSDGRRKWDAKSDVLLRREYSQKGPAYIARELGKDIRTVYVRAHSFGLKGGPRVKKGKTISCGTCGTSVYKMESKIRKNNFCSHKCRADAKLTKGKPNLKLREKWKDEAYRKLHHEHMKKRWRNPVFREKMSKMFKEMRKDDEFSRKTQASLQRRPTKPEAMLDSILEKNFPGEFTYNGDFSKGVMIGGLVPDFVNVNGRKHLVEVFGSYWHDPAFGREIPWKATEFGRKAIYSQLGYGCTVIWDHELKDENLVIQKLQEDFNG